MIFTIVLGCAAAYVLTGCVLAFLESMRVWSPSVLSRGKTNAYVDPVIYDADYYLKAYAGDKKKYIAGLHTLPISLARCVSLARVAPGESVLDLGCGRGALSYYCAAQGCRVTAVDYSEDAVKLAEMARDALPDGCAGTLRVIKMDFKDLDENMKFDCIIMADLVEHLYDWQLKELFAKARSLLNQNTGRLIIHTAPNRIFINVIFPLKRILNWPGIVKAGKSFFYTRDKYSYDPAMHVNEQTPGSLRAHLREFNRRVWCDDGSANVISLLTRSFGGADIWAIARLRT
jgi:SAM-dependent methyltransferase